MTLFFQVLVNALMLGAVYAVISVGVALIFSTLRILQFAHGEIYALGAFVTFFIYGEIGGNYFVALIVALLAGGFAGLVLERLFFKPVRDKETPSMIVGLALLLLIEDAYLLVLGPLDKNVRSPLKGVVEVFGATLPKLRLLLMGVALVFVVVLFVLLRRTMLGRAMRAVAQDPIAARLQGINVSRLNSLGFVLGSALGALGGALILPTTSIGPFDGGAIAIKAFTIVIIGGLGSVSGRCCWGLRDWYFRELRLHLLGPGCWADRVPPHHRGALAPASRDLWSCLGPWD